MAILTAVCIIGGIFLGVLIGLSKKNPEAVKVNPPHFLIVATTLAFFGLIAMIYVWPIQGASKDILQPLLGFVGAKWGDMVAYHFNSSAGSAKKTDSMIKAAETTKV